MTVGNVDQQTKTAAGTTPKGNTNWITYPDNGPQLGLYVDIDTSAAGFTKTPVYVISLGGNRLHWDTTGGSSVYDERPSGFRVYVRWADRTKPPPTPTEANNYGWHVNWTASEV